MSDYSSPYQPPSAVVSDQAASDEHVLTDPKKVPAGQGGAWIRAGFGLFARSPLIWVLNIIIMFVIFFVLALIPLVGTIVPDILLPMFIGGLMLGCKALDNSESLAVGHLFEGFSQNAGKLALVGVMYLVGVLAIIFVAAMILLATSGSEVFAAFSGSGTLSDEQIALLMSNGISAILVAAALFVPLIMAFWFAPALIMFHEVGVLEAMKLSFRGCLRNVLAFLVYGIIALIITLIAALPFLLGLLVTTPALIASVYAAYKDIYLN